jgi:hypothetical protein
MKNLLLFAACLLALSSCQTKPGTAITDSTTIYHVPDEAAINKVVHEAYAAISFSKGDTPNYEHIKSYFIPKAQVIDNSADSAQVASIGQFIYLYRSHVEADTVYAYSEKETFGKTEQFGKIAERISTYTATTNSKKANSTETGVNSFQLIKTPAGWKISSIIWDTEKDGLKVPEYYLNK